MEIERGSEMENTYSLDRIERGVSEDIAVFVPDAEDRKNLELPLTVAESLAGENINEGDVFEITFDGDSPVSVIKLKEETEKRKQSASNRLSSLFKKNK